MEKFIKDAYKTFSDLISEQEFNAHIESMEKKEKIAFLRASLMYQRALKCGDCDPDNGSALPGFHERRVVRELG